jgi:hypothetical protein
VIINRIIFNDEKPLKFMCIGHLEILCPEYALDCIDVGDFVLCASGGCCGPPAAGVCPMIALL